MEARTYCAILCNMATMVRFCQVNECPIREHIILHCKQYQMIVNAVWYQLTRGAVELWKCHHSSGLELLKEIRDLKNFYGIAYIITVVMLNPWLYMQGVNILLSQVVNQDIKHKIKTVWTELTDSWMLSTSSVCQELLHLLACSRLLSQLAL